MNFSIIIIPIISFFLVLGACTKETNHGLSAESMKGPAIVNGESVKVVDPIARSTVAFYRNFFRNNFETFEFLCSGTLIGPRLIMTAAHCISRLDESAIGQTVVGFGLPKAGSIVHEGVEFRAVRKMIQHEAYPSGWTRRFPEGPFRAICRSHGPVIDASI